MALLRLATALIVFTTTCIALGYVAELLIRRRKWSGWVSGLLIFAIALIWPVFVVVYIIYDANRYLVSHPHDDAPAMVVGTVIEIVAPILFFLSFPPTLVGTILARRSSRAPQTSA